MLTIKFILAIIFYYSGVIFALKKFIHNRGGDKGLLVLLYHRINYPGCTNASLPQITVSPEMFSHQMQHIGTCYQPISFSEYRSLSTEKHSSGKIRVLVTFDDGWRDNYHHAYPILTKYQIPAMIFLTTHYIDTKRLFWTERLLNIFSILNSRKEARQPLSHEAELTLQTLTGSNSLDRVIRHNGSFDSKEIKEIVERLKNIPQTEVESKISRIEALAGVGGADGAVKERVLLDWTEIRCMSASAIQFGSHTCNHILLDRVPNDLMISEIVRSKELLDQKLCKSTEAFAYPNGNYNSLAVEEAKRAGYKAAFTTKAGYNTSKTSPFELKRIAVDDNFAKGPTGKFSKCLFEFQIIRHIFGT